jgi:hypothetical protein
MNLAKLFVIALLSSTAACGYTIGDGPVAGGAPVAGGPVVPVVTPGAPTDTSVASCSAAPNWSPANRPAGASCTTSTDCVPVCCDCGEGSTSWLATSCVDGVCADAATACARTAVTWCGPAPVTTVVTPVTPVPIVVPVIDPTPIVAPPPEADDPLDIATCHANCAGTGADDDFCTAECGG